MSGIPDINAKTFDEDVREPETPVVIEFWVRSCGFCQKFKSVYRQLPDIFGDGIRFLRMNMLTSIENLRLAEGMGVEETPTTKVFCAGNEVGEIVGYRSLEGTVTLLKNILVSSIRVLQTVG